jgi:hypothetical protein
VANDGVLDATPIFRDFAETWFAEKFVEWRQFLHLFVAEFVPD